MTPADNRPLRWLACVVSPAAFPLAVDTRDLVEGNDVGDRTRVVGATASIPPRDAHGMLATERSLSARLDDDDLDAGRVAAHRAVVERLLLTNGWAAGEVVLVQEHDPDLAAAAESLRRDTGVTFGPWVVEKSDTACSGSAHYAVRTEANDPRHPHSPRYITFMCGGLGERAAWRREQSCYRDDPETEADAQFIAFARLALPRVSHALLAWDDRLADAEDRAAAAEAEAVKLRGEVYRAERVASVAVQKAVAALTAERDGATDLLHRMSQASSARVEEIEGRPLPDAEAANQRARAAAFLDAEIALKARRLADESEITPTPDDVAAASGQLPSSRVVPWLLYGVLRDGVFSEGVCARALGMDRIDLRAKAQEGRDTAEQLREERIARVRREVGFAPETPAQRAERESRATRAESFEGQRPGQALFNALAQLDPAFAEELRGTEADPFHRDGNIVAALNLWSRRIEERAEAEVRDLRDGGS